MISPRATARAAGAIALLAALSCEGETSVLLTVNGSFPEAKLLRARLIGPTGPLPGIETFPETGGQLILPGTILIRSSAGQGRMGIVLWAEDAGGKIVAQARSGSCFVVSAGTQSRYQIELAVAPNGYSPNLADDCFCDDANPSSDMCPPGGQGGQGGTIGSAGKGGSSGGAAQGGGSGNPGGGSGGVGPADAGTPIGGRTGSGGAAGSGSGGSLGTGGTPILSPDAGPPASNPLFSFDNPADWSSTETPTSADPAQKNQGTASLTFTVATQAFIRSRPFATSELVGVTGRLSLDIFLEAAPSNEANVQLWFECMAANLYNAYIEYRALAGVPPSKWTPLVFNLPTAVANAMKGNFTGCKLWMEHHGAGKVRYDNLGFVP